MYNKIMEIEKALQSAWDRNINVGVVSVVEMNNKPVDGAFFPFGTELDGDKALGIKISIIKVSLNACKSFGYNQETDTFDYDVSSNGKPFYGSIPVWAFSSVIDMDSMTTLNVWQVRQPAQVQKVDIIKELKHIETGFDKPTLVFTNPDKNIKVSKSIADLKLV